MLENHASTPRPTESAEVEAARISSRTSRNTTWVLAISGILAAVISVGVPLLVNLTSGDADETTGAAASEVPTTAEPASSTTATPEEDEKSEEVEGGEAEAPVVEARYKGLTLTLESPELGYDSSRLIDFDGDEPSLADGKAVDHPERDMFYDHQNPEEPSAFFRVNTEGGALLGHGPDILPEDPADCAAAIDAEPMDGQLRQSEDPLEPNAGYCLRTNEGNMVWFSVVSRTGDEQNYRFEFLVTMWPTA